MQFNPSRKITENVCIGLAIFLVATAIRLIYVWTLDIPIPIRGDALSYTQYAINILQHGTFSKSPSVPPTPDSYWAPGYPIFLAICMKLSQSIQVNSYYFTLYFQTILSGLVAAQVYWLGRMLLSKPFSISAALLTALSPHLISHSGYILSETLFSFLLLTSLLIYAKAYSHHNNKLFFLAGLLFGITYLTNPVVLPAPILLTLVYLYKNIQAIKSNRRPIIIFSSVFLCFVFAWSLRCYLNVASTEETSADRAFLTLVIGAHSDYHKIWQANPRDPNNPADLDMQKYKSNHGEFYTELSHRIIANPTHYLTWYLIDKPLELWGWNILVGSGDIFVYPVNSSLFHTSKIAIIDWVIMKNTHYWLLAIALLGFVFAIKERNKNKKDIGFIIYATVISISTVYTLLQTDGRYSVPLRPEMYLCALYGIQSLFLFAKEHQKASINE